MWEVGLWHQFTPGHQGCSIPEMTGGRDTGSPHILKVGAPSGPTLELLAPQSPAFPLSMSPPCQGLPHIFVLKPLCARLIQPMPGNTCTRCLVFEPAQRCLPVFQLCLAHPLNWSSIPAFGPHNAPPARPVMQGAPGPACVRY